MANENTIRIAKLKMALAELIGAIEDDHRDGLLNSARVNAKMDSAKEILWQ